MAAAKKTSRPTAGKSARNGQAHWTDEERHQLITALVGAWHLALSNNEGLGTSPTEEEIVYEMKAWAPLTRVLLPMPEASLKPLLRLLVENDPGLVSSILLEMVA